MKTNFTLKSSLMVLFLCLGLSSWGQTTVTKNFSEYSFIQGDSGEDLSGDIDSVISFTTETNDATTATRYWGSGNSGHIRMYGHSEGNGGSITLHASSDVVITNVIFVGTGTTSAAKYFINDNSSSTSVSPSSSAYTINDIEATDLRFQAASTGQVHIQGVQVTYLLATSCEDSNLTFTTTEQTADIANGTFTQTATSLNATTAI